MSEDRYIPTPDEIVVADYETLAAIGTGKLGFRCFVWDNDNVDAEPLLIDMFTASAMVKVHNALSGPNQTKFERMVAHGRGNFGCLVEFTWDQMQ